MLSTGLYFLLGFCVISILSLSIPFFGFPWDRMKRDRMKQLYSKHLKEQSDKEFRERVKEAIKHIKKPAKKRIKKPVGYGKGS